MCFRLKVLPPKGASAQRCFRPKVLPPKGASAQRCFRLKAEATWLGVRDRGCCAQGLPHLRTGRFWPPHNLSLWLPPSANAKGPAFALLRRAAVAFGGG